MLFGKKLLAKGRQPAIRIGVTFLACLAFMALAVWGWGMPLASVWEFFLISLVLIVVLMAAAIVMVIFIRLLQKLFK